MNSGVLSPSIAEALIPNKRLVKNKPIPKMYFFTVLSTSLT